MKQINISELKKSLNEKGYCKIENFFSENEIQLIREEAKKNLNIDKEIFSIESLKNFFLDQRFLKLVNEVLGEETCYFGESSIYGREQRGVGKFHTDAKWDNGDPSSTTYPIYRMGIFLQDHYLQSGGIKFKEFSHKKVFFDFKRIKSYFSLIKDLVKKRVSIKSIITPTKLKNMRTKVGDILIWNMRLHHCGRFRLLKHNPNFSLPPILEKIIPTKFFLKGSSERLAIFIAWGKDSESLKNYYLNRIQKKTLKTILENSTFYKDQTVQDNFKKNNLNIYYKI